VGAEQPLEHDLPGELPRFRCYADEQRVGACARRPGPQRVEELGDLTAYSARTLKELPGSLRYSAEVFRQLAILVKGSSVVIVTLVMFVASARPTTAITSSRPPGHRLIGLVPGVVGTRLIAALCFGYAFAAKVGCGLVAEIGAMKINEELDAYESEGVSTQRYVVGTRVIAALMFTPIITPIALVAASIGAYIDAVWWCTRCRRRRSSSSTGETSRSPTSCSRS